MDTNNFDIHEYINKKRKKKKRKKYIWITILLLPSILIFIGKAPYFKLTSFEVIGNEKISTENIQESLKEYIGSNIFLIRKNKIKKLLLNNTYAMNINVTKSTLTKITINIEEFKPAFYIFHENMYYIIDNNLRIIEITSAIDNPRLVNLIGINIENLEQGSLISSDITIKSIINKFYPYIIQNTESIKFDCINLSYPYNITCKIGNIDIYFGEIDDIHKKIETIYSIILSDTLGFNSGYIDISFKGQPVIKKY